MDNLLYWLIEYGRVLFGYGFLMFVWPLAVFRGYLKNKSVTFKFSFCVTAQVVIINTVVLMMGLLHILNDWTFRIVFYGTFLYAIREYFALTKERKTKIKYLVHGSFGFKNFVWLECRKYIRKCEMLWKRFSTFYKKHWLEYSLLIVAVVYGMLYFSWGAFQSNSYGFGDMYVHHEWIYQLTQGNIFSSGVYPEAMHCVVYCLQTLFGIKIYSCLLFLAGIHIAIILLSAYCFMKEIFHWRFSTIFVLILFLTVDVVCIDEVFSMSRLQWTLPQEYGFHTIYLCALYLLRYILRDKKGKINNKEIKGCWNEDLLVFALSLAASIAIHFYVTIMAFFLCASVALFSLKKIFNRKHFLPLVAAVMAGVIIAVTPMLGALAAGMKFQGSINWAVAVIQGTDTGEGRTQAVQSDKKTETNTGKDENVGVLDNTNQNIVEADKEFGNNDLKEHEKIDTIDKVSDYYDKMISLLTKTKNLIKEKIKGVYYSGYVTLYKFERAKWIIGITCGISLICISYNLLYVFIKIRKKNYKEKRLQYTLGYPILAFASFLYMVIYAAPFIGLPELIAGSRLCSTEQMLILMMIGAVLDIVFCVLTKIIAECVIRWISVAVAVVIVVLVYKSGMYHGYLYFELTRYNAAVATTNNIIESLPQYSYTIVSTTDEIYQVIQDGRHEEVLTFLKSQSKEDYILPTEYVFIFVEKKPIRYAHNHFASGPAWMALNKYEEYYKGYAYSVGEEVVHSVISFEAAQEEIRIYNRPSIAYSYLESRTVLESKLYEWCKRFEKKYPYDLKKYYEDEYFVCYYFRQNTQRPYELGMR